MKCPLCNGKMKARKVDFSMYGESFGKFEAEVCDSCGEEFFDEKVTAKIDQIAKERELWGLEATTKVSALGNAVAVRITKKLAQFLELKKGEEVRVYPENKHKLVISVP